MKRKSRNKLAQVPAVVPREFVFWLAAGVIFYSILVPLLAFESLILAESILQFGVLHQLAMLIQLLLVALSIAAQMIVGGWQNRFLITLAAAVLLLVSIQPSTQCCTSLVTAIAGMIPWSEVSPLDAIIHLMPVLGSTLIVIEPSIASGKLTRWFGQSIGRGPPLAN